VAQVTTVLGHGTLTNLRHHADREKNPQSLEGILAIDQEGDTWRKDNIFGVLVS
jgi:hypothetical protein